MKLIQLLIIFILGSCCAMSQSSPCNSRFNYDISLKAYQKDRSGNLVPAKKWGLSYDPNNLSEDYIPDSIYISMKALDLDPVFHDLPPSKPAYMTLDVKLILGQTPYESYLVNPIEVSIRLADSVIIDPKNFKNNRLDDPLGYFPDLILDSKQIPLKDTISKYERYFLKIIKYEIKLESVVCKSEPNYIHVYESVFR